MDVVESVVTQSPVGDLFDLITDVAAYPQWLNIVVRAEPVDDEPDTWIIDLQGRIGRMARSKRLRMVRTAHQVPTLVRFERAEVDGRRHAVWRLTAQVRPRGDGSELQVELHYGGRLWGPVLERLLADEVTNSRARLVQVLAERTSRAGDA